MISWNGKLLKSDTPLLSASNRGALLGDGLFETLKIIDQHPVFLSDHLCRLKRSADQINLPIDCEVIRGALTDLIGSSDTGKVGSARITVFRGDSPRGMVPVPLNEQSPDILISIADAPKKVPRRTSRLVISQINRSSSAPSSQMKTLSYTDNIWARSEAAEQNADDAIVLNENGDVASSSYANVFVEMDGQFVTPPLSAGVLPGIVRQQIIQTARANGVQVTVRRLRVDDLLGRWVYRTNSLIGVDAGWIVTDKIDKPPQNAVSDRLTDIYAAAEMKDIRG